MDKSRRNFCTGGAVALGALIYGRPIATPGAAFSDANERVIKIQATKFRYTPNRIELKKGLPVVLELTSEDFIHGFKIADMNIRTDLPPGQLTKIRLTPDKAGTYEFLCDNFCGSGHEEMNGKIVVKD